MKKFRQNVQEAVDLCNIEIKNRKMGIKGESTIAQLENTILPELEELAKLAKSGRFPAKGTRFLSSFAHAFTIWGWNMQEPTELFVKLSQLNNQYKEI